MGTTADFTTYTTACTTDATTSLGAAIAIPTDGRDETTSECNIDSVNNNVNNNIIIIINNINIINNNNDDDSND